jgi:hypothetical protein
LYFDAHIQNKKQLDILIELYHFSPKKGVTKMALLPGKQMLELLKVATADIDKLLKKRVSLQLLPDREYATINDFASLDEVMSTIDRISQNMPLIHPHDNTKTTPVAVERAILPGTCDDWCALPIVTKDYCSPTERGVSVTVATIQETDENGKTSAQWLRTFLAPLYHWDPFESPFTQAPGSLQWWEGIHRMRQLINSFAILGLIPETKANSALRALYAFMVLLTEYHSLNSIVPYYSPYGPAGNITTAAMRSLNQQNPQSEAEFVKDLPDDIRFIYVMERNRLQSRVAMRSPFSSFASAYDDPNMLFSIPRAPMFGHPGAYPGPYGMGMPPGFGMPTQPPSFAVPPQRGGHAPFPPNMVNPGGQQQPQQQYNYNPYGGGNYGYGYPQPPYGGGYPYPQPGAPMYPGMPSFIQPQAPQAPQAASRANDPLAPTGGLVEPPIIVGNKPPAPESSARK